MKKKILGLIAVVMTMLLTGCNDVKITATSVKNVNLVSGTSVDDINVYCPTGICTFELSASKPATVKVTMHYDDAKLFSKIEGLNVIGNDAVKARVLDKDQFSLDLTKADTPVEIQVIDYYRN